MSKERPFEDITPVPNIKVGYFEKEAYLEIIDRQAKQIDEFAYQIIALQSRIDILEKKRTQGEWIPVSERLPDKSGRYLITIREGIWTYKKRKIDTFDFDTNNCEEMIRSVSAWQPLPEPYKEDDSENEDSH